MSQGKKKSGGRGRQGGSPDRRTREQQALQAARQRPAGTASSPAGAGKPAEDSSGTGVTRYYLDVSAIRIQEWLARTPSLKQWRGASVMLSDATSRDAWKGKLPAGTRWNDEAGDLAGVVSLLAESDSADEAREALVEAARVVAADLRARLPHCPIRGFVGSGTSYARAYAEIDQKRRAGMTEVDAPTPPPELVLAMLCETCLQAPAVRFVRTDDGEPRVCDECARRLSAAGRTTGGGARVPRAEAVLRDKLVALGHPAPRFPDTSNELAEAALWKVDDVPSQVALIYVDGNRVGAFLEKAAKAAATIGRPAKEKIVTAIGEATTDALATTVHTLFESRDILPVMPHLADGDDLMVSVAAPDAWPFVHLLLDEFSRQLAMHTQDWPQEVRNDLPTVSAGVVFHHRSHPFSDAVHLVKDRLRAAKEAVEGRAATVDFLDLTADGGASPESRARTLVDLDADAALLGRIAQVPAAQRATLVGLCRQAAADDAAEDAALVAGRALSERPAGAESAAEALARRLVELGAVPLWKVIGLRSGADAELVRDRLVGRDHRADRGKLRAMLDMARWWPAATQPIATAANESAGAELVGAGR
ncbi:MAG TPA: hypothetical protein VLJ59_00415 [Mycobacteriales bacterium]|nr:hypothetical protein [Mycobacteriales bacterium]